MERLAEIRARLDEIGKLLESDANLNLDALDKEISALKKEERALEKRSEERESKSMIAQKINDGQIEARSFGSMGTFGGGSNTVKDFESMEPAELRGTEEYRKAFFKSLQGREMSDIEKRAMRAMVEQRAFSSGVASMGSVIPTTTYDEVLKRLKQSVALLPHIQVTTFPGNVTIPVEIGEDGASWVEELAPIPETGNPIGSVKLGGFTLAKLIPVSIAAESMSAAAFEDYIVTIIVEKMQVEIEKAILNGSGVGQPTGILTGVTWTDGVNSFEYQAADGIDFADMLQPLSHLGSEYRANAAWCMNSSTLYGEIAALETTTGESVFVSANDGFPGKILGKDVIIDEYMPDGTILFGNFRYYFMNFSQPFVFEKSRESGFRRATVDYRSVAVLDGKPASSEAFVKLVKSA